MVVVVVVVVGGLDKRTSWSDLVGVRQKLQMLKPCRSKLKKKYSECENSDHAAEDLNKERPQKLHQLTRSGFNFFHGNLVVLDKELLYKS